MKMRGFRLILLLYLLGVTGGIAVHHATHDSQIPARVIQAESMARWGAGPRVPLLAWGMGVAACLMLLIGSLGLFVPWPPARHFFLASYVVGLALGALTPPWTATTNWGGTLAVLAHLLGGAILTICYSQLGAKLFVTRNFRYDGELALALLLFVVLATGAATTWSSQGRDRMLAEDFEQRRTSWDEVDRPVRLAELDVAAAIETYKATHGSFPASLEELQLTNLPSGVSTSYLACFEYSRHGPPGEGYGLSVQMGGIGVALDPSDFQRIKAVRPGSPAAKANVSAGDYVLIADGTDVTHASYRDFLAAVRGPPGTRVTLTLRKKNSELVETVTLTREPLSGHYRRP